MNPKWVNDLHVTAKHLEEHIGLIFMTLDLAVDTWICLQASMTNNSNKIDKLNFIKIKKLSFIKGHYQQSQNLQNGRKYFPVTYLIKV